jgi:trans-aconitate methyltransferase
MLDMQTEHKQDVNTLKGRISSLEDLIQSRFATTHQNMTEGAQSESQRFKQISISNSAHASNSVKFDLGSSIPNDSKWSTLTLENEFKQALPNEEAIIYLIKKTGQPCLDKLTSRTHQQLLLKILDFMKNTEHVELLLPWLSSLVKTLFLEPTGKHLSR